MGTKQVYAGMAIGKTLQDSTPEECQAFYIENPELLIAHNLMYLTTAVYELVAVNERILAELRQAKKDGRPLIQPTPRLFVPNK